MKQLSHEEFKSYIKSQCVEREDFAFICPMCGTVQSANSLISAGAGTNFDEVSKYLAFSCVGRFTGKGSSFDENDKKHGCNWTLGGLFQLHKLEVITEDGKAHPSFEPASAEQAQALLSGVQQ